MAIEFKIKVTQIGNSLKLTIPKPIANSIKIKKGDTFIVKYINKRIVYYPERLLK